MKFIIKIFKALNSAQTPWQVTSAITLGMVAGLTPFSGIQTPLILFLVFLLNIHLGLFFVSSAFFAGTAYLFDPLLERVGSLLLHSGALAEWWTLCYNNGLLRMSNFNNTLVLGSTVIALLLAFPLYLLTGWLIRCYRTELAGLLERHPRLGLLGILKASARKDPLIRWWGAGVFAALAVLVGLVAWGAAAPAVRWLVEEGGSRVLAREVRVGGIELALLEGQISLKRLEIAGEQEGVDALSLDEAVFDCSLGALLMNRLKVERLAVKGIGFYTPATLVKKPALSGPPDETGKDVREIALPSFELPGPEEVLARADLRSVKVYRRAEQSIPKLVSRWERTVREDFSEDSINRLRDELTELRRLSKSKKSRDLLRLASELSSFSRKIREKQRRLDGIRAEFGTDRQRLLGLYREFELAYWEDLGRLGAFYQSGSGGVLKVIGPLLGDGLRSAALGFERYYRLLQPLLKKDPTPQSPPRGEGRWVRFKPSGPVPDFWIAAVEFDGSFRQQVFSGTIRDLTLDQRSLGRPLKIAMEVAGPAVGQLSISAEDNRLGEERVARLTFFSTGGRPGVLGFGAFTVGQCRLDSGGEVVMHGMERLAGHCNLVFTEAVMTFDGTGRAAKTIEDVIGSMDSLRAEVSISGSPGDVELEVATDLDDRLGQALVRGIKKRAAAYQRELTQRFERQAGKQLADLKGAGGSLVDLDSLVAGQSRQLADLAREATGLLDKEGKSGGGLLKDIFSL